MDGIKLDTEDEYESHDPIDMYGAQTAPEDNQQNTTDSEDAHHEVEADGAAEGRVEGAENFPEGYEEEGEGDELGKVNTAPATEETLVGAADQYAIGDNNTEETNKQTTETSGEEEEFEGGDETDQEEEAGDGDTHEETVFMVDENGDHVEDQEDYDLDFNEYVGPSDEEEIGDAEEYEDEYNQHESSPGLVVPDVGITRESSMISRITNESDIFANPRKPSLAFSHPSLHTLSEEMKQYSGESDSNFISMMNTKAAKPSRTATTSTTASTGSTLTNSSNQTGIVDHHNQFISNTGYAQSVMSYDDDDDDDAFSFQINDDKEYEIGYTPAHKHDEGELTADEGEETDTNITDTESIAEDDARTPVDETSDGALPPVPFAPPIMGQPQGEERNRDSIINAEELQNEVGAMRNQFVRSDMHPSVMSKVTNLVEFTGGDDMPELPKGMLVKGVPVDSAAGVSTVDANESGDASMSDFDKSLTSETLGQQSDEDTDLAKTKSSVSIGLNSRFNKSASTIEGKSFDNSSSVSGSTKSLVQPVTPKNIKAGELFARIPDVDLVQMFANNPKAEDNLKSLREIRIELSEFNTGLADWISFNMGDSMKINMEEDKLGVHVRKAFQLSEEGSIPSNRNTFTNIGSFSDTVENMAHEFGDFGGRNVSKFKDVVKEVKVKKIGQRGKTLLRKLKKVPEFSSNN